MTRLIVDGRERVDTWKHLPVGDVLVDRDFTVGLARWLEERRDILAHVERTGRSLGLRLAIDDDPAELADDIERFSLIVIQIPGAADGRFFSIAARIREHLRYRGELRVTGDVAPDQLSFMQRCGINAFELGEDIDIERFIRRYERFYQSSGSMTTGDNLIRVARRRHARPGNHVRFEDQDTESGSSNRQAPARNGPRAVSGVRVTSPAG